METIYRPATERSPLLVFDFASHRFRISGESYPEDAAAFYVPVLESLRAYLNGPPVIPEGQSVEVDLHMSYFNSSTAKALMNMFQLLEAAAEEGIPVEIDWYYQDEEDPMMEFGEDFREDFEHATFNLCVATTDAAVHS